MKSNTVEHNSYLECVYTNKNEGLALGQQPHPVKTVMIRNVIQKNHLYHLNIVLGVEGSSCRRITLPYSENQDYSRGRYPF